MERLWYVLIFTILWAHGFWGGKLVYQAKGGCPETLPTTVTDMFTLKGDTIYLKQGVDFVISTRGVIVDTAGIIHRK